MSRHCLSNVERLHPRDTADIQLTGVNVVGVEAVTGKVLWRAPRHGETGICICVAKGAKASSPW
jgi:hypothetical protein